MLDPMPAQTDRDRARHARFEHERRYHVALLGERDPGRRASLYEAAYGELYALWEAEAPEKDVFGFQEAYLGALAPLLRDRRVIDFGCGFGLSTIRFAALAEHVIGVETNDACIDGSRRAAARAGVANVTFLKCSDGLCSALADASIDVIYSNDVFEHLHPDDLATHLAEARRLLRPGGSYVCITPNRSFGPHDVSKHFLPPGAAPEGLHLREYTSLELARAFRDAGYARARAMCFSARLTGMAARLGVIPLLRPSVRDVLERKLARSKMARRVLALETVMLVATR